MYEIIFSRRFKKMRKRLLKSGSFDRDALNEAITVLSNNKTLDQKFHDHQLSGNFAGVRECHLASDLLLIYEINDNLKTVTLAQIGSHSELFG